MNEKDIVPAANKGLTKMQAPHAPSAELAAIVGEDPITRGQALKKMWEYIKEHDLQDKNKKTLINSDEKLKGIFQEKDQIDMRAMYSLVAVHLRPLDKKEWGADDKLAEKAHKFVERTHESTPSKEKGEVKKNAGFEKMTAPHTPSTELSAIVGEDPITRGQAIKKIWEYVKKKDLQDKENRQIIHADKKLKAVVQKDQVNMFTLQSLVALHLRPMDKKEWGNDKELVEKFTKYQEKFEHLSSDGKAKKVTKTPPSR